MTLATQRWQEKMRYAADTGIIPPARRTGSRRFGQRLLMGFVAFGSALIGIASYAGRGSNVVPDSVAPPAPKVALAAPEPAKRRSFTSNVTFGATPPLAEPGLAQATTDAMREDVT